MLEAMLEGIHNHLTIKAGCESHDKWEVLDEIERLVIALPKSHMYKRRVVLKHR